MPVLTADCLRYRSGGVSGEVRVLAWLDVLADDGGLEERVGPSADDWYALAACCTCGTAGGRQLLSAASVGQMTTDHLTRSQRDASRLFLEGQGGGFGGSVDVEAIDPWNVPGATAGSAAPERRRTSLRPPA
jgi:hypothetical protein